MTLLAPDPSLAAPARADLATTVRPVLLCGGAGTRLWPLSRGSRPKPFVPLLGGLTPFAATARRLRGAGWAAPLVLAHADHRFLAAEALAEAEVEPGAVLLEPARRDTAPAVLAAALHLLAEAPDVPMLLAPTDHAIPAAAAFRRAVERGLARARAGRIVLFGIRPARAETGYGWLEPERPARRGPVPLRRFREKPGAEEAEAMLAAGGFLWNAGLVLATPRALVAAFEAHAPALVAPVRAAVAEARADLGFLRLAPEPWETLPAISLDRAVLERARGLDVVPFRGRWSDLGGWDAVRREAPRDGQGVATAGPATALDCRDTLLRSEDPDVALVGLGLRDVVAVATGDAVLVAHASRAQDVGAAVEALRRRGAPQAERCRHAHRPWGGFECLARGPRFQVKRITVRPGGRLSLQTHRHRAEHWVVVEGTARVTVGDAVRRVGETGAVHVPLGAVHRLENPGTVPLVLIEVQTGAYLGEDDIERLEDAYGRDAAPASAAR